MVAVQIGNVVAVQDLQVSAVEHVNGITASSIHQHLHVRNHHPLTHPTHAVQSDALHMCCLDHVLMGSMELVGGDVGVGGGGDGDGDVVVGE